LHIKAIQLIFIINGLTVLLIFIIALFPQSVLRIVLGLPFVLLFPGFVLITALFPRKENLSDIERIALSFGLSLAVVPLNGLVLNYLPWGINLNSILYSLSIFIVVTSVAAWLRQKKLSEDEKFSVRISFGSWSKQNLVGKVLSVILVFTVVGLLGVIVYTIAVPRTSEQYTEFYVLNIEGKATDYPDELKLGETAYVILGVANHERQTVSYTIEIQIDGEPSDSVGPMTLEYEEKRESIVEFHPQEMGERQKVEFLLYKDEASEPYLKLHLWINVK
jgi:uncharacterized membrane protein